MAAWFKAAAIRAIKTAAQSAVAIIGTSVAIGQVDWVLCGSAAALSAALSLLTSVAGIPEVDGGASPFAGSKEPDPMELDGK